MYGWIIDRDYINVAEYADMNRVGSQYGEGLPDVVPVRFNLYDDDRIKYYSGLFYTDNADGITEEETYDVWSWGAHNAGTVYLEFPGHPEGDIG